MTYFRLLMIHCQSQDLYRQFPEYRLYDSHSDLDETFKDRKSDKLNVFHLNIIYYYKRIDEFIIFLKSLAVDFDVIALKGVAC